MRKNKDRWLCCKYSSHHRSANSLGKHDHIPSDRCPQALGFSPGASRVFGIHIPPPSSQKYLLPNHQFATGVSGLSRYLCPDQTHIGWMCCAVFELSAVSIQLSSKGAGRGKQTPSFPLLGSSVGLTSPHHF